MDSYITDAWVSNYTFSHKEIVKTHLSINFTRKIGRAIIVFFTIAKRSQLVVELRTESEYERISLN